MGHPDRLRQGRHRLPARHRRREDHELARRLAPGAEVRRPRRLHQPRARLPRLDAQVPRLLEQHERRQADRRGQEGRPARSSRTCRRSSTRTSARASSTARPRSRWTGTTTSRCSSRSSRRSSGSRPRRACTPTSRASASPKDADNIEVRSRSSSTSCSIPMQYADFVNTTGTAYVVPRPPPHVKKYDLDEPDPEADAPPSSSASSSTTTSAPRARSSSTQAWQEVKAS